MKKQRAKPRSYPSFGDSDTPSRPMPEKLFYDDLSAFLEDFYRASYRMERPDDDSLAVMVSPERFARLLRSVFVTVGGRATIAIAFDRRDSVLWMHFSFPKELLTEDDLPALFKTAMAANFAVTETENGLAVGIPLTVYGKNRVYARDTHNLYDALYAAFAEETR